LSVKQISIFVENKPGTMNEMTQTLTDHSEWIFGPCLSGDEGVRHHPDYRR
jgi:hypothetical protein